MKKHYLIIIQSVFFILLLFACRSVDDKPKNSDLAGSYYRVKTGDTLEKIAKKYRVSVDEIMDINGILDQRSLRVGQALFLPDPDPIATKIVNLSKKAKIAAVKPKKSMKKPTRTFLFPVPGGTVIHEFSRSKEKPYDGLGIKAELGTKVINAKDGQVLFVGNDGTKFGLLVIVEHKGPYVTVYTHLDKALVKTGQKLKQGEVLGAVGKSGGARFAHLHFQIRRDKLPEDPRLYLSAPH